MAAGLPKKLRADAVIEAVLEIRFEPDPNSFVELILGRFADTEAWKGFNQTRLPIADVPAAIRRADPNLRYQAIMQLSSADGRVFVGIGENAVTLSRRGAYPGWAVFGPELHALADRLFAVQPKAKATRVGLRYINALRSDLHQIKSVADIELGISVANTCLNDNLNLNYKHDGVDKLEIMSRIATVDMAQGLIPEKATVVLDIDVYTKDGYSETNSAVVKKCIENAHDEVKKSFFAIIGEKTTERLRQD